MATSPRSSPDEGEDRLAIASNLAAIRRAIAEACDRSGRDPSEVRVVAATKAVPVDRVLQAREEGVEHFAENYAKDLLAKATAISATWHFIGKVQVGTASKVADAADFIHSAEPGRGLERVARRAARRGRVIDCLVQVDFTGRRQGIDPVDLGPFVDVAQALEGIDVVGLMTVPPPTPDSEGARPYFARLRELRDGLRTRWSGLVHLSMGMSADYPVAVEEGATMVRVGTALFGERPGARPQRGRPASGRGQSAV